MSEGDFTVKGERDLKKLFNETMSLFLAPTGLKLDFNQEQFETWFDHLPEQKKNNVKKNQLEFLKRKVINSET